MIWLWIAIAVAITALLLREKNIEPHNFLWALIPIDRFGITVAGFTLKPVYIYSIFLIGYYIVTRKFRLKVPTSVFLSVIILLIGFFFATFFRFGSNINSDVRLYAMFFFTVVLAACFSSMLEGKDNFRQVKDVMVATAVGYGILFIILCSLDAVGITLPDVKSTSIWDVSVVRVFRNMQEGSLVLTQRLRGFYLDANAGSVCFVVGLTALLCDWLEKGFTFKNFVFAAIISSNIFLTGSRTAIVLAIAMLALTVFRLFSVKVQSTRKLVFLSVILIGIVFLILFFMYNTVIFERLLDLISSTYFNRSSLNDDGGRISIWKNALSSITSDNWYCGVGIDGVASMNSGLNSHNTFIEAICGNGVPFGIIYSLFFLYPFVFAYRKKDSEVTVDDGIINIVMIYISIIFLSFTVSHISSIYLIYTAFLLFSAPYITEYDDTNESLISNKG